MDESRKRDRSAAGAGGVEDQPGKAETPLDQALGDVDMLDPGERDRGLDPDEKAVTEMKLVFPFLIAPGAVAAAWKKDQPRQSGEEDETGHKPCQRLGLTPKARVDRESGAEQEDEDDRKPEGADLPRFNER